METFRFCYYIVNNQPELHQLFNSVNKDSKKNEWWITLDNNEQLRIDKFKKLLLEKYYIKGLFPRKENKNKYTLNELCKQYKSFKLFEKYTPKQLLKTLEDENNKLYRTYYHDYYNNKTRYYAEDVKVLDKKIIFLLKNNNFLNHWQNTEPFIHKLKQVKKNIPKLKRDRCWINRYNDSLHEKCPIPACSNILDKCDSKTWQAGHITSESNGGSCDITNLRPICPECNQSMGKTNWNDYLSLH